MTKDFVLVTLEVIMVVSVIVATFSFLIFREGGLIWGTITRKAIVVSSIFFGIFMLTGVAGISIEDPSKTLSAITCFSGMAVVFGAYFVFLYNRLPHFRKKNLWLQQERQKYLGIKRESQEDMPQAKDSNDSDLSQG